MIIINNKLRKIINYYGINKQLKYFQSEVFELNEAIILKQHNGCLENAIDVVLDTFGPLAGIKRTDYKKEHIKEEIADVMVMLKQIQLYYNISSDELKEIMNYKINRQIKRIEEEDNND